MSLLPIDLTEVIGEELARGRRPNDGLLHASSHITAPLRHAQLDVVGAPKIESELLSEVRMFTGTQWHTWLANTLRGLGLPYMAEVNVTSFLPPGWGGTADMVIWNPQLGTKGAFVLVDLKTTRGEQMFYISRDGAKDEHQHQVSAYWHALKKMGIPLAKTVAVYYLPMGPIKKDPLVEPILADFEPIPAAKLHKAMAERSDAVFRYRESLPTPNPRPLTAEEFVTDELAPEPDREQRLYYERNDGTYTVKLMPVWQTQFCPYPDELCSCRHQGQTKIGLYDHDGTYHARPGYEDVAPTVKPA